MANYGTCLCGSGLTPDTGGQCAQCRFGLPRITVTQPRVSMADVPPQPDATVRIEKLVGGYLVQINYGRAEVYPDFPALLARIEAVLR